MKPLIPLVAVLIAGAGTLLADSVQETYTRGLRAYSGGNVEQAEAMFREVLAADPNHRGANACLKRIQATKAPGSDLKKQVENTIVPSVDFKDASLSSVLDYLPTIAAENAPDQGPVNIVRLFPSEYGTDTKITLQLANVPLSSVLDYIAQLGGVKLDYQPNAIVVSQAATGAAATQ